MHKIMVEEKKKLEAEANAWIVTAAIFAVCLLVTLIIWHVEGMVMFSLLTAICAALALGVQDVADSIR